LLSPRASLILTPAERFDVYVNFGFGFHSNDARGVVRGDDPVTPLTRARGYELGFRTKMFERLDLAASAFLLDLDSEIVWVGDEGTTEASGPTRRTGIEGEARLRVLDWLFADLDLTVSNGVFRQDAGNGTAIALAPRFLMSAGISARHPSGAYGRLGLLHIADRPATEDEFLKAPGFTRLDLGLGYRNELFDLSLSIQNLTNTDWREAQFANVSRLPNETGPASCPSGTRPSVEAGVFKGCEDIHFTPGAPINVFGTATLFF
jgi:outer membrane receptor protein involved in Fe transport